MLGITLLLKILFIIILIESILFLLVKSFKKDFKWIITKEDEFPFKSKDNFEEFFKNSFDRKLGWDRKKNTLGYEKLDKKLTSYKILKNGSRNSKLKNKKSYISVFGDSYAFCRYSNDEDTWESFLECKINSSVKNYGVGNFGLDQSFLKYKKIKLKNSTKIIIFAFVPETISRINSYWKHYSEFGNKLGFKPVYKFKQNSLKLFKNPLNKPIKMFELKNKINEIKKIDDFYLRRFLKYMFKFPFILTYFKSFQRNNIIFLNLIFFNILKLINNSKKKYFFLNCYNQIIKDNIYDSDQMYKEYKYQIHFEKLMYKINTSVTKRKRECIFLILPQLHDLKLMKKKNSNAQYFFQKCAKKYNFNVLDLSAKFFSKKDYQSFFLEDKYGGHLSRKGNKFVSKQLFRYIKDYNIL